MARPADVEGFFAVGRVLRECGAERGNEGERPLGVDVSFQFLFPGYSGVKTNASTAPRLAAACPGGVITAFSRSSPGGRSLSTAKMSPGLAQHELRYNAQGRKLEIGDMTVAMPLADETVLGRRADDRSGAAAYRPRRGRDRVRRRHAAVRERRAHSLPPASHGRRAAGNDRAGRCRARLLPSRGRAGRSARGGDLAVRRCVAARRRRAARHGQVQPYPRDRLRQPCRRGRVGRDQSRGDAGGRTRRLLLRARSILADRLHHRRQRGGEFRRRALPQIRRHHQQRARLRTGADDRRNFAARRQASRRRRLRSARHRHRLRRPARRRHRSRQCAF